MAWFGWLGQTRAAQALQPGRSAVLSSPWSPGLSTSIMAADWLGATNLPVTREQAMTVPAVVAARNLLCESLAQGVLQRFRGQTELTAPVWTYRTDSELSPYHRLLWTADDLLFSGFSLWQVLRDAKGQVVDALRVPVERWDWDADFNVLVDEQPVAAREVVLFLGWDEGLLITGAQTIRSARDLADAVAKRVKVPRPHTTLYSEDQNLNLNETEVEALVASYATARRSDNGAVSFLPQGIKAQHDGEAPVSLFEDARNAEALDVSRLTGIPADLLEASQNASSLTYETRQGQRSLFNDVVRRRARPIEARLSLDDVVPRGQRIALDLSALQPDETALPAPRED